MKRTFCDRCGKQCVNTTISVRIETLHHTSAGEFVGEDSNKPIEICKDCGREMEEFMPQAFVLMRHQTKDSPMMINEESDHVMRRPHDYER